MIHLLTVISLAIWMYVSVAWVFDIVPTPGTVFQLRCITHPDFGSFGILLGISSQQFQYSFHVIVNLVLNILTIYKLSIVTNHVERIGSASTINRRLRNTIRTTMTIITISLVNTILYIPCAITWPIFGYLAVVEKKTQFEYDLFLHSANLSHTFLLLTGLDRIVNFLVLCTMPSFRQTLTRRSL